MSAKPTAIPQLSLSADGELLIDNPDETAAAGRAALRAMSADERAAMQAALGFSDETMLELELDAALEEMTQ